MQSLLTPLQSHKDEQMLKRRNVPNPDSDQDVTSPTPGGMNYSHESLQSLVLVLVIRTDSSGSPCVTLYSTESSEH